MKRSKESPQKIPLFDLNFAAFHLLNGNPPELELQGTRVIFLFQPDDSFYRLSALYNSNSPVNVLDYVNVQRQLKARMLAKKGGEK